MKIDNRLKTATSLINDHSVVFDVGCDHALADIYLVKNNENVLVYAADNKSGPLQQATKNIKKYRVQDKVIPVLSEGLEKMPDDTDTIMITGMGGLNIINILITDISKLKNINNIVLGPQQDISLVRKTLIKNNFHLVTEKIIYENKKYYFIQKYAPGKKYHSKLVIEYGHPDLYQDKIYKRYLKNQERKTNKLLLSIPNNQKLKKYQLKKDLKKIAKLLNK